MGEVYPSPNPRRLTANRALATVLPEAPSDAPPEQPGRRRSKPAPRSRIVGKVPLRQLCVCRQPTHARNQATTGIETSETRSAATAAGPSRATASRCSWR